MQNEYLEAENRILRTKLPKRLRLSDPERVTLAEIGKACGQEGLAGVACVAKPDTILAWYRKLIARKFDGSRQRQYPGRPRIDEKLEADQSGGAWAHRHGIASSTWQHSRAGSPGAAARCRGRISWRRT